MDGINILIIILLILIAIFIGLWVYIMAQNIYKSRNNIIGGYQNNSDSIKDIPKKYLYNKYPKFCCNKDPKPLFRIDNLDKPWQDVADIIINKLDPTDQIKNIIENIDDKSVKDDTKFLYYLMCNPNIECIVSFGKELNNIKYIYKKELKDINYAKNIYYQIAIMNSNNLNILKNMKSVDKPMNIYIYFCDKPNKLDSSDMIFCINKFYNLILAGKLFLNKNSLELIKYQDLKSFNMFDKKDSRIKLNSLLNFMNQELSLKEQESIQCFHGIITYYLGLRNLTDIDYLTLDKNIIDKCNNINILDGNLFTKDNIIMYNARLHRFQYINNIDGLYNPDNYGYIFGIKCITLDNNMRSRYIRQRPKAISEIIAFNNRNYNKKYKIPRIPEYKYIKPDNSTYETDLTILVSDKIDPGYRKKLNEEKMNKDKFIKVTRCYLKKSYKINMSFDELKNILENYDKTYYQKILDEIKNINY